MEPDAEFSSCDADEVICPALENGIFIEYKVDKSYEYYLENWQQ